MQEFISNFHFLRPYWLLALLPVIALGILLWRQKRRSSEWQSLIQPELLKHLLEGSLSKASRWQSIGLIAGWVIACLALAGPSWQRLPMPVHQSEGAVVVLFDVSPSMVAEDIKPSRLQRARYKLRDYLSAREEGLTALVAYAGEAHVVSPLTDDTDTLANLLPALHPDIMPLAGSNIEMAVDKGLALFADAGIKRGELLLVTDGVAADAFPALRDSLADSNIRLSVLGVGTADGAPIPTGDGGFARGGGRDIVIAKLNNRELQELSSELGGTYAGLSTDDRDIQHLLAHTERQELLNRQQRLVEREFDSWRDNGQWLALLLLPFVAFGFRRGWLLSIGFLGIVGVAMPNNSYALEWRDLWLRSDQQGLINLEKGDPEAAAAEFKSHDWRGTAHYRGDNFPAAAEAFAQGETADDHYNHGNALAKAGSLEQALEAYERALTKQPDFADAEFNANLVRKLLEQQEQAEQDPQNAQDSQDQASGEQDSDQQESQQQQDSQQAQQSDDQNSQQQQGQNSDSDDRQQEQQSRSDQNTGSENEEGKVDEEAAQELADRQSNPEPQAEKQEDEASAAPQSSEAESEEDNADPQDGQLMAESESLEDAEQQQALEQWLRQVPDDPSGLLRRKFEYEHRRMRQQYRTDEWLPPENQSSRRW